MKVGLLGGSFDPVHNGHLKLAQAALKQLSLSKVYLVLTPQSPFKQNKKPAPLHHRLRMLRLALVGKKGLHLGGWELKRKGPAYTVDTVSRYKKINPKDQVHFILGSDSFRSFGKWKAPEKIISLAQIVVGRRPGAQKINIPRKYKSSVHVLRGVFPDISSTALRKKISHKKISSHSVPPAAARYIREKHLYSKIRSQSS